MSAQDLILAAQWFFLLYFIALSSGYIMLNLLSLFAIRRYVRSHTVAKLPRVYSSLETPISILVPAYNEEASIVESVRALLQLEYASFEVIVINDGSRDGTLDTLIREFSLVPFPEAYRVRLRSKPVREIYRSTFHKKLRVIDKENGGKADSLNAGINACRFPLYCGVDADSVLQPDSLQRVITPFVEDRRVVACGGTVRIANGCQISGGFMERVELPASWLARFQIAEYLRAFLFGRLGWSPLNALLIISGAFGVFRKEEVVRAGGYRTDTVGEDMELVVRLHRTLRRERATYRITFVPDPICWTEAPEDLRTLKNQRTRWQRGLAESLTLNFGLFASLRGGAVGWIAFPFMFFFELLGPLIEVIGYVFFVIAFVQGWISGAAFFAFLFVAVGLGIMLSTSALLLEEISFHVYPRIRHVLVLFLTGIAENFGFRQLISFWRLVGLLRWLTGRNAAWGEMRRRSSWSHQR